MSCCFTISSVDWDATYSPYIAKMFRRARMAPAPLWKRISMSFNSACNALFLP